MKIFLILLNVFQLLMLYALLNIYSADYKALEELKEKYAELRIEKECN